jgi:hypothetical protein
MAEEDVVPEQSGEATEEVNPLAFSAGNLPEGLRAEPSLQTFDSVDKLAKSYVNAVKKIGGDPANLVSIPQDGESWDSFYNQMGRPETPEGYELGDDPDNELEFYRNATHQLGLTQEQAQNMLELYASVQEEQTQSDNQATADFAVNSQIELKREWGTNYDGNLDQAQRAFSQFASPEFGQLMDDSGLGNHPELVKAFAKIGAMLGEDRLIVGSGLGQSRITPHDAKDQIQSLYQDKDFSKAYRDNKEPGHKAAMDKMDKLFKSAYPGP